MAVQILLGLAFVACASAASVRTTDDGFMLDSIDGEKHFTYGVIPYRAGVSVHLEIYDARFNSTSCDDVKLDVYRNGYVMTSKDLVDSLCNADALNDFVSDSSRGFLLRFHSSANVRNGQLKARVSCAGGFNVPFNNYDYIETCLPQGQVSR